jgi:cysteine desulfuration protein SufE
MTLPLFAQIKEDLTVLDSWEDKYRYLLDLGKSLDPLPQSLCTPLKKVSGCVSQLWVDVSLQRTEANEYRISLRGDSDAHIVRGLAALIFSLYQGSTPKEALSLDVFCLLKDINLENHLTPQRSNGLHALVGRIRKDIQALQIP